MPELGGDEEATCGRACGAGGVLDLTGTRLRMGRPGASWWARWRITCAGGTGRGVVKHGGEDGGRPVVLHCVCGLLEGLFFLAWGVRGYISISAVPEL